MCFIKFGSGFTNTVLPCKISVFLLCAVSMIPGQHGYQASPIQPTPHQANRPWLSVITHGVWVGAARTVNPVGAA